MFNGNGNGNMVMPVSPMYGNGGYNGGGGGFLGGDGIWAILLFALLFGNGGWGGFGGFGNGVGGFAADGAMLYPWMNQAEVTTSGFQNLATQNQITQVQSDLGDIQTQLCNGFANTNLGIAGVNQNICQTGNGITAAVTNGFAQAEISNNARQIANMQQDFASQTAITGAINGLAAQQAQCCCDNRAATADLKYTVATENCADRTAAAQNTRDIIDAQTRGTQAILDKLCALELDGVKGQLAQAQRENVGLQNQLNMASMAASQADQTAKILAGQASEIEGFYNRLKNSPVPSTPVCGMQPIFTCNGNNNPCGCGCGV